MRPRALLLSCAVLASTILGVAAIAHSPEGQSAAGLAFRLLAIPALLLALDLLLLPRVSSVIPSGPSLVIPRSGESVIPRSKATRNLAVPAGLCLGLIFALANALAAARSLPLPPPRYPFGPEPIPLLPALVVVALLSPIVEELFFRGILLRSLASRYGPTTAVLVSTAAFAVAHGEPALILRAALAGLIVSLAYLRFRSLAVPILAHLLDNFSYILLTTAGLASPLSPTVLLPFAAVLVVALALFSRGVSVPSDSAPAGEDGSCAP